MRGDMTPFARLGISGLSTDIAGGAHHAPMAVSQGLDRPNGGTSMTTTPKTLRERIGQRIKQRREELGIPVESIAARLGVTGSQIRKLEKGYHSVTIDRLLLIADMLSVSLDALCGEDQLEPDLEREVVVAYRGMPLDYQPLLLAHMRSVGTLRRPE